MSQPSTLTYKRTVLHSNEAFEIVACEWNAQSFSKLHGHGWSQCAVFVEAGEFENKADFGHSVETQRVVAGQMIVTPLGVQHEIRCLSAYGKTLHVYMPRIQPDQVSERYASEPLKELQKNLNLNLPVKGIPFTAVLQALRDFREKSISTESPRFMNQLFSGIFPETIAANEIVSQTRTTLATFESSPVLTAVEIEVVNKLCVLLGWDAELSDGISVAGGSAANFMAVHCARQKHSPDAIKYGNERYRYKVFASKAAHYSLKKACVALGLGSCALVLIETDASDRMMPSALAQAIAHALAEGNTPLMVCATAGTTVMGAFDPIAEIAEICRQNKMWLHVDAAWGGPALFSQQCRSLVYGIASADSVTFDAHKLFGSSLTASFFLTRQKEILFTANDVAGGDYLFHSDEVVQDRGRLSWQCGRGADCLSFWTLWKHLGSEGIGRFVDRLFELREELLGWIRDQNRLELVGRPTYLNLCVRVKSQNADDPHWSRHVREEMKRRNFALVNYAQNEKGSFLRLILAHPRLQFSDVRDILEEALRIE